MYLSKCRFFLAFLGISILMIGEKLNRGSFLHGIIECAGEVTAKN